MAKTESWLLVDVGNVLIGFDHATISARLQAECLPPDRQSAQDRATLDRFIFGAGGPNEALDRGMRDLDWLRGLIARQYGVAIDAAHFEEIWTSIFHADVNDAVVAWTHLMKAAGARIAICSNTNRAHWDFLRRRHERFRALTDDARWFLSFEMGLGKADPGFFALVLTTTGATGAEHLLVDDKPENVAAARAAGLHGVLFNPSEAVGSLHAATTLLNGGAPHVV